MSALYRIYHPIERVPRYRGGLLNNTGRIPQYRGGLLNNTGRVPRYRGGLLNNTIIMTNSVIFRTFGTVIFYFLLDLSDMIKQNRVIAGPVPKDKQGLGIWTGPLCSAAASPTRLSRPRRPPDPSQYLGRRTFTGVCSVNNTGTQDPSAKPNTNT